MARTAAPGTLSGAAGFAMEATPRVRALVVAPLLLRIALGSIFFAHGAQKLFGVFGGAGMEGTARGFTAMGLHPAFLFALVAGALEFFGALLLAIGWLTRPVATLLAAEMLFAGVVVHLPNGFFLNWACAQGRGHGIELSVMLVGSLGALALLGPGRASVDGSRAVRRRLGLGVPFRKRE